MHAVPDLRDLQRPSPALSCPPQAGPSPPLPRPARRSHLGCAAVSWFRASPPPLGCRVPCGLPPGSPADSLSFKSFHHIPEKKTSFSSPLASGPKQIVSRSRLELDEGAHLDEARSLGRGGGGGGVFLGKCTSSSHLRLVRGLLADLVGFSSPAAGPTRGSACPAAPELERPSASANSPWHLTKTKPFLRIHV